MSPLPLIGAAGIGAGGAAATGAATGGLAAGGAAAGGILGMPWSIVIPILLSIFGGLFEKSPEKKAEEMQTQLSGMGLEPPFQNPYLPQMSEAAFKAAMSQMGRTQNWGWPAGKQMDTGWIQDMIGQIKPALPAPVAGGVWNPTMGVRG